MEDRAQYYPTPTYAFELVKARQHLPLLLLSLYQQRNLPGSHVPFCRQPGPSLRRQRRAKTAAPVGQQAGLALGPGGALTQRRAGELRHVGLDGVGDQGPGGSAPSCLHHPLVLLLQLLQHALWLA